jgi:hypothetical protein
VTDPAHAHRLRRGYRLTYSGSSGRLYVESVTEVIYCEECDLVVPRPDGVPDYSRVDRLWSTR